MRAARLAWKTGMVVITGARRPDRAARLARTNAVGGLWEAAADGDGQPKGAHLARWPTVSHDHRGRGRRIVTPRHHTILSQRGRLRLDVDTPRRSDHRAKARPSGGALEGVGMLWPTWHDGRRHRMVEHS